MRDPLVHLVRRILNCVNYMKMHPVLYEPDVARDDGINKVNSKLSVFIGICS